MKSGIKDAPDETKHRGVNRRSRITLEQLELIFTLWINMKIWVSLPFKLCLVIDVLTMIKICATLITSGFCTFAG